MVGICYAVLVILQDMIEGHESSLSNAALHMT